jgi:hypothetical protein
VVIAIDEDRSPHQQPLCHVDRSFDVEEWKQFGRAVVQKGTLEIISLQSFGNRERLRDADLLAAAERCLREFFAEVKHLKSMVVAELFFEVISIDDLNEFIVNNEALNCLTLASHSPVLLSLEQSAVMSRAISNAKLVSLNITECEFPNDGSFERMLEGCANVRVLEVKCEHGCQCTAVAALLRDPARVIEELNVDFNPERLDLEQVMRDIAVSLVGNTHLKSLDMVSIGNHGDDVWDCFDDYFGHRLLCNASSIWSIISKSNHTLELENISFADFAGRPTEGYRSKTLEELNKNDNSDKKEMAIRNKILQFYFVGEFDVSPFDSMHISVLPEVMGQIEGNDKQSALYRLLHCMPELSNVAARKHIQQPGNKRQKKI